MANWLPKIETFLNLSKLTGKDIKKMLILMGANKSYQEVMADHLFAAIVASSMVFLLPLLTGFWGYIFLQPVMFVVIMYIQAGSIHKQFKLWQNELIKDLPSLIDKMQISLEAGKPFIHTFQQVQKTVSPRLAKMLERLIIDMQSMKQTEAIDLFARSTGLPVMLKFSAAIKVGLENGYFAAENHFNMLKADLRQLRLISLGELTKSKPEQVKKLHLLMGSHAIAALALAMYAIFKNAASVM